MREEELKLEKVKKSCNITAKVSKVFAIITGVAACICLVAAIVAFILKGQVNAEISKLADSSEYEQEFTEALHQVKDLEIGGLLMISVDVSKLIENGQYGEAASIFCLVGVVACTMAAVAFDIIRRIFNTINTSETPFSDEVIKKIKILFIIITVEILLMSGLGEAAFAGLICWSVYNILDYGYTLQKQADETI